MLNYFQKELTNLKKLNLYRELRVVKSSASPEIIYQRKKYLLFSSNNYLGLANHKKVISAQINASKKYAAGSGASRLVCGNIKLYQDLEYKLAKFKESESSLVFATGYMTNLGVISALVTEKDLILSDALNHASIVDACRLTKAKKIIYPHSDFNFVQNHLKKLRENFNNVFIITDGIFSMDGDIAPLPQLTKIAKHYKSFLIIDDAHATGIIGEQGKGSLSYYNLKPAENIIQIATLSKAIGNLGGFVCAKKEIINFLINKSRPLIYATALPPAILAGSLTALKIIQNNEGEKLRTRLKENYLLVYNSLKNLNFKLSKKPSHIIPVIIGDNKKTLKIAEYLFKEKIFAPAIRPPSVPEGQSRIRITVMATHSKKHLEKLIKVFKNIKNKP